MFVYVRSKLNELEDIEFEHNTETNVDNFYLHRKEKNAAGLTYTVGSEHVFQLSKDDVQRFPSCTDKLECIITFMLLRFYDGTGCVSD